MKVNKKEAALLQKAIRKWSDEALINPDQAKSLSHSFEESKFDWQTLSFYAFVFAIASIIISAVALLADKWLMQLFDKIVDASEEYKAVFFSISSIVLFFYGQRIRKRKPNNVYSHSALNLLGIMTSGVALGYFSIIIGEGSGHFSIFVLIAALLYGFLGIFFKSRMLWTTALMSIFIWFGVETSYIADWQPYFWNMNIIVRYIPFSIIIISILLVVDQFSVKKFYYAETLIFFCVCFLGALWMTSIFGNQPSIASWSTVSQSTFLPWSLALLLCSILVVWLGVRYERAIFRETGIIFIILNVYSRYFEYGWELLHPTVFFAFLGLSFWLIGKKAEKIWTISSFKKS